MTTFRPFEGRSILVTGAGGSIGSQLCRLAMSDGAARLVLVSRTEAGLYNVTRSLEHGYRKYRDTKLDPLLGDAGDLMFMTEAMQGCDLVIHAAAHKHVPICERNPIEAIANNVFGTEAVIEAADRAKVSQMVLVSSDKAVNPTSVMGATKRLAELLIAAKSSANTKYFTVRFGNVMDSAGSVLPLWREQIAMGGPITLTDERCTRYFMSIDDAVGLIAKAIELRPLNGTFVLDMGEPINLMALAKRTIKMLSPFDSIEIQTIGLRPGEKLTEELHYGGEVMQTGIDRLLRVNESPRPLDAKRLNYLRACIHDRRTARAVELLREIIGAPAAAAA